MLTVLLVEDNPSDAELIKEYIDEKTFIVIHVKSLTEALSVLGKSDPDIIILDLGLPESTGIDTFRQFKKVVSKIPIVVVTGLDDPSVSMSAIREGAQDYIVKHDAQSEIINKTILFAMERHKRLEAEETARNSQKELLEAKNKITDLLKSLET